MVEIERYSDKIKEYSIRQKNYKNPKILVVIQTNSSNEIINIHGVAFNKEEDAIDEAIWQNKHETSENKWHCEYLFLKG